MAKELSGNMSLIFAGKVKRLNSWLQVYSDLCGFPSSVYRACLESGSQTRRVWAEGVGAGLQIRKGVNPGRRYIQAMGSSPATSPCGPQETLL